MPDQTSQTKSNIERYLEHVTSHIDANGIYPVPGLVVRTDSKVELFAFATDAHTIIRTAIDSCLRPDVVEIVIGLDTYCLPDQGTTFESCLIVFHIRRDCATRIGVLEYAWSGGQAWTKPVDWENLFWLGKYADLTLKFTVLMAGKVQPAEVVHGNHS